jgi:hypothetical protein
MFRSSIATNCIWTERRTRRLRCCSVGGNGRVAYSRAYPSRVVIGASVKRSCGCSVRPPRSHRPSPAPVASTSIAQIHRRSAAFLARRRPTDFCLPLFLTGRLSAEKRRVATAITQRCTALLTAADRVLSPPRAVEGARARPSLSDASVCRLVARCPTPLIAVEFRVHVVLIVLAAWSSIRRRSGSRRRPRPRPGAVDRQNA